MMAIDMGGPFNKAAYVFGVGMLAEGIYDVMAAVMIGGMIPPIAIALSTTFFKNRWTNNELKSGPVNYIMGLCFITEGAIPYAAADPLRVIPSCVVGSAVGGGLSMLFGCKLMAPHGGIFVFPVVENVLGYIIALVVGSLVGMVMLAILKKKKTPEEMNDKGSAVGLVLE
jgi:PTS system fructose-specific IIC component